MGIAEKRINLSGNSLAKYFGISSPKSNRSKVERINISVLLKLKTSKRKRVISEEKVTLIILLEIKIVEKKVCCFSVKNEIIFAERLFLRARNSIFNLFETTKAISEAEKKPLSKRRKTRPNNCNSIL
jgi:hypothetical protein